jgi:hypothetical protein
VAKEEDEERREEDEPVLSLREAKRGSDEDRDERRRRSRRPRGHCEMKGVVLRPKLLTENNNSLWNLKFAIVL